MGRQMRWGWQHGPGDRHCCCALKSAKCALWPASEKQGLDLQPPISRELDEVKDFDRVSTTRCIPGFSSRRRCEGAEMERTRIQGVRRHAGANGISIVCLQDTAVLGG